jgi:homoserine dehydrogenase
VVYRVGLLGLGTVGTGVVEILQRPPHPLLQAVEIAAVGVRSLDKPRPVSIPPERLTTDPERIVSDPEIDVVIELMGGLEPARSLILKAIDHGKPVITANKAVIARYGMEIFQAAAQARVAVLLEAAVGGGIPIIQALQQSLRASRIQAVWGIINGTTNFILSQMAQEGSSFAEALAQAQAHGYAEANPSADVEGWDAADKIAILASLAFGVAVPRQAIPCEGIGSISPTDLRYAREWGYTFKLLAIAQRTEGQGAETTLDIRVHPALLPVTHPLANIQGADNAVWVQGDPLGQVVLAGPGAGRGNGQRCGRGSAHPACPPADRGPSPQSSVGIACLSPYCLAAAAGGGAVGVLCAGVGPRPARGDGGHWHLLWPPWGKPGEHHPKGVPPGAGGDCNPHPHRARGRLPPGAGRDPTAPPGGWDPQPVSRVALASGGG